MHSQRRSVKRQLVPVLLAAAFAAFAALPAAAQDPVIEVQAEIPFDFYVGGEHMPAGTYEIENFPDDYTSPTLNLSVEKVDAADGESHFTSIPTVAIRPTEPSEGPRLVFERVGDVNLLVKVIPTDGNVRRVER